MPRDTTLIVGDKIDLTIDGRNFYKSRIDDIDGHGFIMISAPLYRQTQMHLRILDELYMVYYRESGRYIVLVRVVDIYEKNGTDYPLLELLTDPEKDQRREHYRLPVSIVDTVLFEYTESNEILLTIKDEPDDLIKLAEARAKDISVSGIALMTTKWVCEVGDRFILKLYLEGIQNSASSFCVCAKVMRSEVTAESGVYDVGMQFFGIPREKTDLLTKYIMTQQQKRILQQRLIEGNN